MSTNKTRHASRVDTISNSNGPRARARPSPAGPQVPVATSGPAPGRPGAGAGAGPRCRQALGGPGAGPRARSVAGEWRPAGADELISFASDRGANADLRLVSPLSSSPIGLAGGCEAKTAETSQRK